jgi:hypothetical protein
MSNISLINIPEIPDSVDNALQNLTDAPTKNIGQTFSDIWYLALGGISQAAEKKRIQYAADLEKYRKELTESIDAIPPDKKLDPSIQITAQALENSKYCISSDALRKMFVNLISGTMNASREPLVHPSFPEMIKQMDDTDARILMELKQYGNSPIVNYQERFRDNGNHNILFQNAYISKKFNLSMKKCSRSLSLLERMGLIKLSYMECFTDKSSYEQFKLCSLYHSLEVQIINRNRKSDLNIEKGVCYITPLGRDFIDLCVS